MRNEAGEIIGGCAVCGADAKPDDATCSNCGEASWLSAAAPPAPPSEAPKTKKAKTSKKVDTEPPPTDPAPASEEETKTTAEPIGAADNEGN